MRSKDVQRTAMWTTVSTEELVPIDHPLRAIRVMVNAALDELSPAFTKIYSRIGRPSIALRAIVLQMFYTVRSERLLMEQLRYNMLFRWFVGLSIDEAVWDVTVFTKTASGFWKARSLRASLNRCWAKRGPTACSVTSTLPLTGH